MPQSHGRNGDDVRIDYPGLLREVLPSGAIRWRVRVERQKARRILLTVAPGHPMFGEHYHAARLGIQLPPPEDVPTGPIRGSVGWLIGLYVQAMEAMVADKLLSPGTLHQRRTFLDWVRAEVGEYSADMPSSEVATLRDRRASTPGAADNLVKAIRAMYAWSVEHGHVSANPAAGIAKINPGQGGAVPWSVDDLRQYRERHPRGTMAHLALTLFMFSAARISDVVILGRGHEFQRRGVTWLDFQPTKRGARRVRIPMLPPLWTATRASPVVGKTYLLTEHGKPFASPKAFANRFAAWCVQAGLKDSDDKATRSSHGIRKAAGELLALEGASQYQIMAIHGHASAKTSEIYTEGVNRDELAAQAMALLGGMEW